MAAAIRPRGRSEKIRLDQLICDPALQKRVVGLDTDHADDIRKCIKDGRAKGLEKIKVRRVTDDDKRSVKNYVTDGFNTVEGYRRAGVKEVPCDVLNGTYDDAFFDSCGANAHHLARKRTVADREKAVADLIEYTREKGEHWSQNKIADVCRVDRGTVKRIIERLGIHAKEEADAEGKRVVVGKNGKASVIGPRKTKERSAAEPEIPVSMEGGWREMPLGEFLEVADYMWDNFKRHAITTAGQLHDAMRKGRLIGFMGNDRRDCIQQIEKLREAQEVKGRPVKQGAPVMEWAKVESYLGVLIRLVDEIGRVYPDEHDKPEAQACHRNLRAFEEVFGKLKGRLTKSAAE